ncbi:MAG: hypothetical protein J2P21_30295 [Chloracidobacterium sp.]|nr:hypothetical protein [Chloracidobacterium sp.]
MRQLTWIRYGRAARNLRPVESGSALRSRNATAVFNRNPSGVEIPAPDPSATLIERQFHAAPARPAWRAGDEQYRIPLQVPGLSK